MEGNSFCDTVCPGASGNDFYFHFGVLKCKGKESMFKHQILFLMV